MAKNLLLVSARSDDQEFAKTVSKIAGLELVIEGNPYEAAKIVAKEEPPVVFVDCTKPEQFKAFEEAIAKEVGLFSEKLKMNALHYLTEVELGALTYLFSSPIFGSFVRRNYGYPLEAGELYGYLARATLAERAFGLANFMAPQAKIQEITFSLSTQKQQGVEAVKNFLLAVKFKSRMATVIANAVDELIMNAIFDAPVDESGKPLFMTTPRDAEIELKGKQEVKMQVAFDGKYVAITAADLYGSLDKLLLFEHISKRYQNEEYKVKKGTASAGIGLSTIFRTGGSFFFVSETRVKTEVTVFFRRTDNFRDFKDQFRFISTQFYF